MDTKQTWDFMQMPFKKSRPVAYALQPALDKELLRLQQTGILEPVESSEWATPLVIVPRQLYN